MDVIIFGTGVIGKGLIKNLNPDFHVMYFVDNNVDKQGKIFENYEVKSPDHIKAFEGSVIIASTKYSIDIMYQLLSMGVEKNKIFFCRRSKIYGEYYYDVYPLLEEKLESSEKELVEFDIKNNKEIKNENKRVLVFVSFYSTYTKQLIENISKRYDDVEFSIVTAATENAIEIVSDALKHVYCFRTMSDLKKILKKLPMYDAAQILFIEQEWVYFSELIKRKVKKMNLCVGGSDFYRASNVEREYKKKLVSKADFINGQTPGMVAEFKNYYCECIKGEIGLLPYGVGVLDYINERKNTSVSEIKEKFGIPLDKIIVTCGHNANEAHQHIKMIDSFLKLSRDVKSKVVFVFPMTYPSDKEKYIEEVKRKLELNSISYVILEERMNFLQMAEYALISDIMIHVQTTDQLSSAMLEEMYAGTVVLAGKWLPYKSLHEKGIYFLDINTVEEIHEVLTEVIENIEKYKMKCRGNKQIIWEAHSWDALADKWYALWR